MVRVLDYLPVPCCPGFSMGGGLALEALGDEAFVGRVAGIFCHSSFLSDDSSV